MLAVEERRVEQIQYEQGVSPVRNSFFRKKLGFIPELGAKLLLDAIPDFDPNILTVSSAVLTTIAAVMAERRNRSKDATLKASGPEAATLIIAQVLDAFDGAVAREKNRRNPGSHDTKLGGSVDSAVDRWGNLVMGISRIISAHRRGDFVGKVLATVSTLTGPVPALLRSIGETKGLSFPEGGKNILGTAGTQTGRVPLGILGTLRPEVKLETLAGDLIVQNIADTLTSAGNIKTSIDRLNGGTPIEDLDKLKKIKDEAKYRQKWLLGATIVTGVVVTGTHLLLGKTPKKSINSEWLNPVLNSINPESIETYHPKQEPIPGMVQALQKLSGGYIEVGFGYGSAFSKDAAADSVMDIMVVVRDPEKFYSHIQTVGGIKLGTIASSKFHALWNKHKVNFYLGELEVNGVKRTIKLGVIGHNEFLKHARGGGPAAMDKGEGEGYEYLSGRLHKANVVVLHSEATPDEQKEINIAINQARIDAAQLTALGLMQKKFPYEDFAEMYVKASYLADRRVERANKAESLLHKNPEEYRAMLTPILTRMVESGMVSWDGDNYQKQVSLSEQIVKDWLRECRQHSFRTNFFQNIWTMGLINAIGYGIAKVIRAKT